MYLLLSIECADATRTLKLKNLETKLIEECFDDSALVSDENFEFMKIGQIYDCKIKLFGMLVSEKQDKSMVCKIVEKDISIGRKTMVKVLSNDNEYYIPKQKLVDQLDFLNVNEFNFNATRKDLIQVNTIIHADIL